MIRGILVLFAALWATAATAACLQVSGERIVAADLARANPAFRAIPPDTQISYAPMPGVRRVFGTGELERLAARFHLPAGKFVEACFEMPLQGLAAEQIRSAIRQALGRPDATVEVIDFSRQQVPHGEVTFPLSGAAPPSKEGAPVLWRGFVQYSSHRRSDIWARVHIAAPCTRVVAVEALAAGQPVRREQLRVESYVGFPDVRRRAMNLEEVVGRLPCHPIPAGTTVDSGLLREQPEITRGEMVRIDVRSGAAQLSFQAKAESDGHLGKNVSLRNVQSGKLFSARVQGRGKAVVVSNAASGADTR